MERKTEHVMGKQREMFEKWYGKHCDPYAGPLFERDFFNPDEYHMSHTQTAWATWQAAITVQEGYKLVPNEPTVDMVLAGETAYESQLNARLDDKIAGKPFACYPSEETHELCSRVAYRAMLDAFRIETETN